MAKKRRLLIMSDSYNVFTGFACVSRHVADYLQSTGDYEIAYLCWFYTPVNQYLNNPPFTLYTTLKDHGGCCKRPQSLLKIEPGKEPQHYRTDRGVIVPMQSGKPCLGGGNVEVDKYAFQTLHGVILDFKPDLIWTLGDTWMTYHTQFMDIRQSYKWVSYTPIDGSPMPYVTEMGPQVINWAETIDRADRPYAFCDFGRDTMIATAKKYDIDLSKVGVVYHGADVDNFNPLGKRAELKKKLFNVEDDVFVIGCFSRNQPRKAFHKLMEALALGKEKGYWDGSKIKCYFHCPIKDVGWNLPGLIKWHGLQDIVILNDKLKVGSGPTDAEMNELYNACDLMTLPSRGEGWGLTYSEAMAAGVPVLMSSYSAHHDWAKSAAARIKTQCVDSEPITNIDRAIINVDDYCEKIKAFYDNDKMSDVISKFPDISKAYADEKTGQSGQPLVPADDANIRDYFSAKGRELCETELDWTKITKQWEEILATTDTSQNQPYPQINIPKQINLEDLLDKEKKDRILYIMPGTFGDVFLSTAVVDSIKKKYPEKDIYFVTSDIFKSVLTGNKNIYKVLSYDQIFSNTVVVNNLFEMSFTPFMETQGGNNWTKNGHGKHLAQVYADHCGVELGNPFMQILDYQDAPEGDYVAIHVKTGQEPKDYKEYQKVVDRIDMQVLQIGGPGDPLLKNVKDCRNLAIQETAGVIKGAKLFIGGDSICAHIAGYVGTDMLLLYSSTFPELTKPLNVKDASIISIEPEERYGCDRACHMAQCFRNQRSCIDNIPPARVVEQLEVLKVPTKDAPPPTISGYTTTFNPNKYYPWRECIKSMLGFCDEVVVADGGSSDGTYEELKKWKKEEPKLKVYRRRWREDEPMMDGMLKAYARALCTKEFCWQQDADEIVHEDDYQKIKDMAGNFPASAKMSILPVLDLYGTAKTVRTDKGIDKWRFSRNLPEITHGIPNQLRQVNKDGKTYCDKNLCDGCFPINSDTGEMIDGQTSFVTQELVDSLMKDKKKYKLLMTENLKNLPSVWHFSWHDLARRMEVDMAFWDKQWASLDQSAVPAHTRFFPDTPREKITPEMIKARAEELKDKKINGEPMDPIVIDWKEVPKVVKEWLNERN